MDKHAYLIMAHNQFDLLEVLLKLLDDSRNDIYLHIDKKVKEFDFLYFKNLCKKSRLFFLPRLSIKWGDYNQVKCELSALEFALENCKGETDYSYFHWLSGVDLPIKTQDEIHSFFTSNAGKEFVHFDREVIEPELLDRMRYYQFFRNKRPDGKMHFPDFLQAVQRKLGIDRTKKYDWIIQKGSAFWSITKEMAEIVVTRKKTIKKMFSHTLCGDEQFMQTMVINSTRKDCLFRTVFDDDIIYSSMRMIDWDKGKGNGSPWTFTESDYQRLIQSDALFARKFNIITNPQIVYMINEYITKGKNK